MQKSLNWVILLNITVLKHDCLLLKIFTVFSVFFLFFSGSSYREETAEPEHVPAAQVIEHFGFDFEFNPGHGTLEIKYLKNSILFLIGTNEVFINSRVEFMRDRAFLKDDQVLIPSDGVDMVIIHLVRKKLPWVYSNGIFTVIKTGGTERKQASRLKSKRTEALRSYAYEIQAIVIDPGHGGKDPGGIGYNDINEKDIVLDVAKEVKKELMKEFRGKEIIITRGKDIFISLEERGEIANAIDPSKNPIFISIHANVSFNSNSSGYESYFLSLTPFDETARDVAVMENSVLHFEIENYNDYLKEIINRIVDLEYRRESIKLAEFIQNRLSGTVGLKSTDRGVKGAFFYVLKAAKMPAVLVEIGFVTNKEEALNMLKSDYQKRLAKGIAEGIGDFITTFRRTEGFTQ